MTKLCIPSGILDQHLVVLGKTGAGKSSVLRHIVEHLLRQNKRVCIIDPKGDWWGLKSSADGKSAGYPVIAFGDFKEPRASDVPINAQSGKHIAELITSGNRPCIIGFRGWMTAYMVQFWIDFASGIFNANSGELYLVGDEFHNFAPKGKIMDPQAGKCLHWSNRLMSEGRGLGIVCLIASQRPQKVHNDALTSCETLVAMRVVHKADRDAVQAWIEGCGDKAQGTEVLNALAGMPRGEAYVWSPEVKFGPKRLLFPMFQTFDSFAPPQLQKQVSQQGWADVDLGAVKEKLARVIEEKKANDPVELRKRIRELEAEAKKRPAVQTKVETKVETRAEVPRQVFTQMEKLHRCVVEERLELMAGLKKLEDRINGSGILVESRVADVQQFLQAFKEPQIASTKLSLPPKPKITMGIELPAGRILGVPSTASASTEYGEFKPNQAQLAILAVLHRDGPSPKDQLAVRTVFAPSGYFNNMIYGLSGAGLIEGKGTYQLTSAGIGLVPEGIAPTFDELQVRWREKLAKAAAAIFDALLERYPAVLTKAELASMTGMAESGYFNNNIYSLSGNNLISGRGSYKLTDYLMG